MCKFKIGDMVNSTSGMLFDEHWQNCKVVDVYIISNELRVMNQKGVYGVLRMHQCQLVKQKEETMFEVGKKYIFNGFVMECLWVLGDNAILRNHSKPWLDAVYASNKNNFKTYKEYKEPKTYTIDKFVSIDKHGDIYVSTVKMSDYDVDNVGKIKVTYTEGSGLTVDVIG